MTDFNKVLADSTARRASIVPGCVVAAVDKEGERRPLAHLNLFTKLWSYN
jgi:hypothetical protein